MLESFAQEFLKQISRTNVRLIQKIQRWNYSAYTLTKTPNVPLNFQMDIYYSASDRGTGGGNVTTTQQGNLHNGQGYD